MCETGHSYFQYREIPRRWNFYYKKFYLQKIIRLQVSTNQKNHKRWEDVRKKFVALSSRETFIGNFWIHAKSLYVPYSSLSPGTSWISIREALVLFDSSIPWHWSKPTNAMHSRQKRVTHGGIGHMVTLIWWIKTESKRLKFQWDTSCGVSLQHYENIRRIAYVVDCFWGF